MWFIKARSFHACLLEVLCSHFPHFDLCWPQNDLWTPQKVRVLYSMGLVNIPCIDQTIYVFWWYRAYNVSSLTSAHLNWPLTPTKNESDFVLSNIQYTISLSLHSLHVVFTTIPYSDLCWPPPQQLCSYAMYTKYDSSHFQAVWNFCI